MKPRLNCLPLSEEDNAIWHLVVDRFYQLKRAPRYAFTGLWSGSLTQGRRDADLMYQAQSHPLITAHIDNGEHCEVRGFLTSMRRAGVLQ
jgi:hypothetical protein